MYADTGTHSTVPVCATTICVYYKKYNLSELMLFGARAHLFLIHTKNPQTHEFD